MAPAALARPRPDDGSVRSVNSDYERAHDHYAVVQHAPLVVHLSERKCTFSFTEKGTYVFGKGTCEWAN